MSAMDLAAYLARIECERPLDVSAASLAVLHEAHTSAVPFENLDILLDRTISLELGALQAKMVAGRRGGYCFEQNTLFAAVLEAMGFEVTRLAARVRGGGIVRPRTHMLLRVDVAGSAWVADVGFGGDGLLVPLRLAEASETSAGAMGHRLRREGDAWVLEGNTGGGWTDLYAFTLEPQLPVDYEVANHFTSTWPRSPFVQTLTAQRTRRGRRSILRNRDLTIRDGASVQTDTIRDPDHLLDVLDREFALPFPPGTRFSRPVFE